MKLINRIFRGKGQPDDRSSSANPKLIAAIEAVAKNDGTDTRHRLYSALLDATLLVPTPELPDSWRAPGDHIADGKTGFKIAAIKMHDGTQITPVFTDEAALRNWDPNTPWVEIKARDYFPLVVQLPIQGVVINPFDPIRKMIRPGGQVTRLEFEHLAKGIVPEPEPTIRAVQAQPGIRMNFRQAPDAFPGEVTQRLADLLAKFTEIQAAYLLIIAYGCEAPHRAIAIRMSQRLDEARQHVITKSVLEIIRPLLGQKEAFDLIPLTNNFYKDVARVAYPFYVRPCL